MGVRVIRGRCRRALFKQGSPVSMSQSRSEKIIGNTFIDVFDEEATKLEGVNWLAQGTIYPDVIDPPDRKPARAHVIKSHHNVGGLPDDMKMELVEPLRELFKDEVRKLGLELGLPYNMVYRPPIPRPLGWVFAF